MSITSLVRSALPSNAKASLRRLRLVNWLLSKRYGGVRSAPHPAARHRLYFDGYRNIGWSMGALQSLDAAEFEFVRSLISRENCQCAWDIGANVGLWTLFLAGIQPPLKKIISFEPDPVNRRYLAMNKQENHLDEVEILPLALSSSAGTATFFADPLTGSTGGLEEGADFIGVQYGAARQEIQVETATADSQIEKGTPPPQFIKIDVEGHELSVLQGARNLLERVRPSILMEVTRNHDAVAALLREHNYRLIDPESGHPLAQPQFATACLPAERAPA